LLRTLHRLQVGTGVVRGAIDAPQSRPTPPPIPPHPPHKVTTSTDNVVCHFYHRDFERCKIVDKHLALLAKKYMETRFIKLSAPVRFLGGGGWGLGVGGEAVVVVMYTWVVGG
jgi:hypothetical protein